MIRSFQRICWGKLVGDKGYIKSELFDELFERGLELVTKIKNNMKNCFVSIKNKILLKKRVLVEYVIDQLKNICHIDHTRHRSFENFIVNILSGLIAYGLKSNKTSIDCSN